MQVVPMEEINILLDANKLGTVDMQGNRLLSGNYLGILCMLGAKCNVYGKALQCLLF